jgi:hypothetical protein
LGKSPLAGPTAAIFDPAKVSKICQANFFAGPLNGLAISSAVIWSSRNVEKIVPAVVCANFGYFASFRVCASTKNYFSRLFFLEIYLQDVIPSRIRVFQISRF